MCLLPPLLMRLPPTLAGAALVVLGIAVTTALVVIFAESGNDLW